MDATSMSRAGDCEMEFNDARCNVEINDSINVNERKLPTESTDPKSESPISIENVVPLRTVGGVCQNLLSSKILSAAAYGAEANIYKPATIADMELSTPQCLLLALLHSLVAGDVKTCVLLADICQQVDRLRSRHLRVWLLEDFSFPRTYIEDAMALLVQLVADGTLKLPAHVLAIMSALAKQYKISGVQFQEGLCGLAIELENAVTNNSARDIFELVSEGADVCGTTESGDSLLHLAARSGSSASIITLSFLNADLNVSNSNNATPLEVAVRHDCGPAVKALLMAGAKFDKCLSGGDSYLHIAAAGLKNEALGALLEGGLNINGKNHRGFTPLALALEEGNERGIELLLKKGADLGALSCVKLKDEDTIIHCVARSGNVEILKLLNNRHISANIENKGRHTPLHVACNPSAVRMLLKMGVPVDAQDNMGRTPLMMAVKNSKVDVASTLLLNRADPMKKDHAGKTPLHYAAEGGCVRSVNILLDAGGKLDDKDLKGNTPAYFATVNNKTNILQLIVEKSDLATYGRDWILHQEVCSGNVEVVKALLNAGAMVNMTGENEYTALHYAARSGDTEMASALLDGGADQTARTVDGRTALMEACCFNKYHVAELLVDRGALINARDNNGKTALGSIPLHYGRYMMNLTQYLRSKGGIE